MGFPADVVDLLVETFGVFLLPAGVFAVGVGFYVLFWLFERRGLRQG